MTTRRVLSTLVLAALLGASLAVTAATAPIVRASTSAETFATW